MYEIAILGGFLVYLFVAIGISALVIKWLSKYTKYAWFWGVLTFLIINIPLMHKTLVPMVAKPFYCQESGFTLYQSPEQWMQENPGEAQTLKVIKGDNQEDKILANGVSERVFLRILTNVNTQSYDREHLTIQTLGLAYFYTRCSRSVK